ncbi:hypothetical protein Efla_000457 [Eimeria flavescens]
MSSALSDLTKSAGATLKQEPDPPRAVLAASESAALALLAAFCHIEIAFSPIDLTYIPIFVCIVDSSGSFKQFFLFTFSRQEQPGVASFLQLSSTMGRRYSLHVGIGALGMSAIFLRPSEGFKTQRPNDITQVAFGSPSSMVEMKWGTDYHPVPGSPNEDGSFDFYFVNAVEGAPTAQDGAATTGTCGVPKMGLSDMSSVRLMTLTDIADAHECEEACSNTLNCRAAQFTTTTSKCVLLKGLTGTIVDQTDSSIVLPVCESDCFHQRHRLTGSSTSLGKAPNANFCLAMCASNSACNGFTFLKSTGECLSFPSDSDLEEDADATSGSKTSCAPHLQATEYTGSCTIPEKTSGMRNVATLSNVSTYEECQTLCLSDPRCNFLTHNKVDRKCYLKPEMGTITTPKAGDATGPRLCDGTCFLKDIELTGAPDSVVEECVSAHFCHYECAMNEVCDMWSYDEETKNCSLFTKAEELTGRRASGVWTGPKAPCPNDALYTFPATPCALRGVKFGNGEPLAVSTQNSPEQCQNACQQSSSCQAYTYDIQEKKCELFLASAERNKEENLNFISGPRLCSDTCLKQNTDYVGTAIEQISSGISTPGECQLRCQATTNCTHWSFQAAQKLCKLLSSDNTEEEVTGVVGGPKYCQGSCDIRGFSLGRFGWMEYFRTPTVEACRAQCNAKEKCAVFIYSDKCYVLDEFAFVRLKQEPRALTSFKKCSNCFRQGVGYRADSATLLWSTQALNAEECRLRCSYMERCTRFSYDAKTTACELLSGEGEDVEGTNLISGPAQCSRNTSCYQNDGTYEGGEVIVKKTQTPEQCQEWCEKTPSCRAFSHNSGETTCQLWSGDSLTLKSSAGWTYGNKKCLTLGDELCSESSKDYSSHDLYSSPLICQDQQCCRNACVNNLKCKTWMWNSSTKYCWLKGLAAYTSSFSRSNCYSAARTGCPYCARWGESYSGPVVATKQTPTQGQCQLECQLRDDCKAWTFGPGTSCKLYSSPGTVKQTYATNYYSGPREC